jgi:hypothetical protein
MALMACPECHRDCSDRASACPHCGYPFAARAAATTNAPNQLEHGTASLGPIEPHAIQIAVGVALVVLSAWMIGSWLPAHKPMTDVGAAMNVVDGWRNWEDRMGHRVIKESWYPWLYILAAGIGLTGIVQVVRGATFRRFRESHCRRCNAMVRAMQTFVRGPLCPNGGHSTTSTPMTSILFATLGVLCALVAVAYVVKAAG